MKTPCGINRRRFLQTTGMATAIGVAGPAFAATAPAGISFVIQPLGKDAIANSPAVQWAAKELEQSLTAKNIAVRRRQDFYMVSRDELCGVIAAANSAFATQF